MEIRIIRSQPPHLSNPLVHAKESVGMGGIPWLHYEAKTPEGFCIRGQRTLIHEGSSKPVLHFIHGNSYSGLTYLPLWQALSPHADIILHDTQGHGDSDHGGSFVGWNRSAVIATDIGRQLQQHYADRPFIGVGHSFGGVLTSLMAASDPTLFKQLLLLDPIVFTPGMLRWMQPLQWIRLYSHNPIAKKARKRRNEWVSITDVMNSLRGRGMFRGWTEEALRAYAEYATEPLAQGGRRLKCAPEREAEIFSSYARGLWSTLPRIEVPTHAWIGERSYPFVHQSMARWQQQNPHFSYTPVPGGHCFMLEHPEETAQRLFAALKT
ncbi:alpha/beta hydrolase [Aliidiomarina halalkaliphila]|uniref:Alpha/beta hydrolase n=1 Tax=Aliidiomarina halalkaliphila TaxID=2593535 RepID=A0A552X0I4_9GAMM|nr:alpha/beta hydrolase [Aliidiomarina halalkaliphila]TRW48446.1 alpha/beta hydrolase [Aliidiomarina halalkaliphila]